MHYALSHKPGKLWQWQHHDNSTINIGVGITGRNRSGKSDFAYSYTFLRSVVCQSVVCHIRALCLSRSTYLDAI